MFLIQIFINKAIPFPINGWPSIFYKQGKNKSVLDSLLAPVSLSCQV